MKYWPLKARQNFLGYSGLKLSVAGVKELSSLQLLVVRHCCRALLSVLGIFFPKVSVRTNTVMFESVFLLESQFF